ncbi:TlyA family RNA methyltransferase, partial [Clavibacter phaseoli]
MADAGDGSASTTERGTEPAPGEAVGGDQRLDAAL